MNPSILVFGAGENQITLIDAARRLGYRTVAIDPNPEAMGRSHADVFVCVGAKDYERTREVARQYGVSGIVTGQMENPLPIMARLAEEEGYIFPSVEVIRRCRNKYLMKQAFQQAGVPCARGLLLRANEISPEALSGLRYPLIIKPLDQFSGRGVFRLERFEEIGRYLEETLSFCADGTFLIEEYIDGEEFSVESITYQGQTTVMQITRKFVTPFPRAIEMAHIEPADLDARSEALVKETTCRAIAALGIMNSAGHTELKVNADGCFIIELGSRMGGGFIASYLVDLSTGTSLEEAAVRVAMGCRPVTGPKFSKYSMIQYFACTPGRVVAEVVDWSEVFTMPGIRAANIFVKPGMTIPALTDNAKRSGYAIAQANSVEEVKQFTRNAVELLTTKVLWEGEL